MPIARVSQPKLDERRPNNRGFVRFQVNRQPDRTWIHTFKDHAASSALRAENMVFTGRDVTLELIRPKSLAELATALDCFIEGANLGLRGWGGVERSSASARGLIRDRV